jgi:hypothetical protein
VKGARETFQGWIAEDMKRGGQIALANALDGLRKMREMAAGSNQEPGLDIAIVFMEGLVSAGGSATTGEEDSDAR